MADQWACTVMRAVRRVGRISSLVLSPGRNLLASSFTAVLFVSGCSRAPVSSPGIAIEHAISPQPVRVGPITVTLQLADAAAKPIVGARITVEADMTHPGMSPVFGVAEEVAPGQYQSQVRLGMAGDWVILLHATLPDGKKLERQFDVRDVRPN
jgi:YtkA-like